MRNNKSIYFVSVLIGILLPRLAIAKETTYYLNVNNADISINGQTLKGMNINGQVPAPILEFEEGDDAIIHVKNNSSETTSLHWHGLLLPAEMDGVPGLNGFGGIKSGESFTYKFKIRQSGTYWYHSHSNAQEARGLYGPLIIYPKGSEKLNEHVILLADFTNEQPSKILNNLKVNAGHYKINRRTIGDFVADAKKFGLKAAAADRAAWGKMRMDPTDLADVTGYDYLINGKTFEEFIQKSGQKARYRIINGSAMTYFDFHIQGEKFKVIAADGRDIEPVEVDALRIAVAETYDIEFDMPQTEVAKAIVAEALDRSGYVAASIKPFKGALDNNVIKTGISAILTMKDMGMGGVDMSQMDHSKMSSEDMAQMHASMGHSMKHGGLLGSQGGVDGNNHPYGWESGFENEKVLTYADLKSKNLQKDTREADREIIVRIGGNMERYIWTINGQSGDNIPPINLKYGERVKLVFINESMMAHPMHLHGMFVQLNNGQDMERLPDKHIVSVLPGETYTAYLTADEVGEWSFHCHLLNHMVSGMMTKVVVAKYDGEAEPKPTDHSKHIIGSKMDHSTNNELFHRVDVELMKSSGSEIEWLLEGFVGNDTDKLYFNFEGQSNDGEFSLLYGRKIADFWDFQTGINSKFGESPNLQIGFKGLAPYNIETDAHLFLGDDEARIKFDGETNFYLNQVLAIVPNAGLDINLLSNQEWKAGLNELHYGIGLRYDFNSYASALLSYSHVKTLGEKSAPSSNESELSIGAQFWF